MYCKYCGSPIDNDSRFCSHCGRQLSENDIVAEKAVWTNFGNTQQHCNIQNKQDEIEEDITLPRYSFRISFSKNFYLPIDSIWIYYSVTNCTSLKLSITNKGTVQIIDLPFTNDEEKGYHIDLNDYEELGDELRLQLIIENDEYAGTSEEEVVKIATNFKYSTYNKTKHAPEIGVILILIEAIAWPLCLINLNFASDRWICGIIGTVILIILVITSNANEIYCNRLRKYN